MGRRLKGKSMEVPPPFVNLKVSRGQRGGAIPGRRSLEGVGGVLGSRGKFLVSFSLLFKKSAFIHLRARDWRACAHVPVFGRVEREEMFEEK